MAHNQILITQHFSSTFQLSLITVSADTWYNNSISDVYSDNKINRMSIGANNISNRCPRRIQC